MLIVIAGGDANGRADMRKKFVRGSVEELNTEVLSAEELAAMASTQTLTGETFAFLIRSAFFAGKSEEGEEESPKAKDFQDGLLEIAGGLAQSPHTFVFDEEKLPVKIARALEEAGAKIELLEKPEKKEEFNVFGLADALAKRDRKTLWLLLIKALRTGLAPENIAGVLAWKARTMLASARTPGDREWLQKVSRDLVVMYHDAHRGAGELGLLLEKFVLNV